MKHDEAQWKISSPLGPLYIVASDQGLRGVFFDKQEAPFVKSLEGSEPTIGWLAQGVQELQEYFNGERKKFDIPLDMEGTDFQKRVWKELRKIPYGKTVSYKDIAEKLNTKGVRAVGTANGRNPLCIIIPCHRVISSDGSLGGYSGGLDKKIKLLHLEKYGPGR